MGKNKRLKLEKQIWDAIKDRIEEAFEKLPDHKFANINSYFLAFQIGIIEDIKELIDNKILKQQIKKLGEENGKTKG